LAKHKNMRNMELMPIPKSVLTVGGAGVDNFKLPKLGGPAREEGDLYVREIGSKNPGDLVKRDLGGNGANVSRALARLGLHSALYTHLGHEDDPFTPFIQKRLEQDGVRVQAEMADDPAIYADNSDIILLSGDRVIESYKIERPRGFDPELAVKPDYLYLTSVGKRWEDVYAQATELAKQQNIPLAVSPGSAQLHFRHQELYDAIGAASLIALDLKEGKSLLGKEKEDETPPVDVLLELQELGAETVAKTVSVTDGKEGSYLLTPEGIIYRMNSLHVPKEKVADTTGAGDSYAAGILDALVRGESHADMMRQGALNGASVVQVIGPGDGLLTREQMDEQLKNHPKFQPEIIRKPVAA
jgi:2-dehydro-3-deoxygluconokinase